MIGRDLAELIEGGVGIVVGTRDAENVPDAARAWGCRVAPDCGTVTVWIPDDQFPKCLHNLRSNGRIAVTFARPVDYRAVQLKGRVTDIRPSTDTDASLIERYRQRFFDNLVAIGIERDGCELWASSGCTAVTFSVTELYQQTPGPGAGERLGDKP
jgi:hypothetical protein